MLGDTLLRDTRYVTDRDDESALPPKAPAGAARRPRVADTIQPRRSFLHGSCLAIAGAALLPRMGFGKDATRSAGSGPAWAVDDPRYEIQRLAMGWQARKAPRRPDLIVQATSDEDVIAAVRQARAHRMKVAVRSGGHSWVHSGLRDGGMLIDLSRLGDLTIAPDARSAIVGPGLRSRELLSRLAPAGLAFPVAHCGSVAMGGYLLGGGSGWNGRSWGDVACFSVTDVDVVTARGEYVRANENENTDLFWAARGAGPGFFGVVTGYRIQLYPLPKAITTSSWCWPLERARDVAHQLQALDPTLPDAVEMLMFLGTAPEPLRNRCAPHGRMCSVTATAFVDAASDASALLARVSEALPEADRIAVDELIPTPFEQLFAGVDQAFTPNRYAADTLWSDAPLAELVGRLQAPFEQSPAPLSMVLCEVRRKSRAYPDAAYSMFAPSFVSVYSVWSDADDDASGSAWLRSAMAAIEPIGAGFYVNEADLTIPDRASGSFAPMNWQRLVALRHEHDPERLFHWFLGRPENE